MRRELLDEKHNATSAQKQRYRWYLPASWHRWLLLTVSALIVIAGISGGALVWYVKHQENKLRDDATAVIAAEARAQALGLESQAFSFADPDAPHLWLERYRELYQRSGAILSAWWLQPGAWQPPTSRPDVRSVTLEDAGRRAVVEVAWTERSRVVERRAYRLIDGAWRRTPLFEDAGLPPSRTTEWLQEQRSDHARVLAHAEDFARLAGGAHHHVDFEGLHDHIYSTWPAGMVDDTDVTVRIVPTELKTPFVSVSERTGSVTAAAPDIALVTAAVPLTPAAQYRLALTNGVVDVLTLTEQWSQESFGSQSIPFSELQQLQARHWALDDTERTALRNAWRRELGGNWRSPLTPFTPEEVDTDDDQEGAHLLMQWLIPWRLFLEQLLVEGYVDTPGSLARAVLASPETDAVTFFTDLTGLSQTELEARARTFALSPE